MKPTLVVLAAGMGSRYGGLKQLDGVGPHGETIMDYSVFDAVRAGFGKVVFIIRHSFADEFRAKVVAKYTGKVETEIVFQELGMLPEGFTCPPGREKPWGTNHALLMAREAVATPFGVINADDFYGKESFSVLSKFLQSVNGCSNAYCMIGYQLGNTLSEYGTVSRGECMVDSNGRLTSIIERSKIECKNGVIHYVDAKGMETSLDATTPVSMNMWGLTPDYFAYSDEAMRAFLKQHGNEMKSEFYIPTLMNELITKGRVTCQMLETPSKWFGVTYAEDRPSVVSKLQDLVKRDIYPEQLWK